MTGARREFFAAVAFAAVMVSLTASAATTWYVSKSGNDSASGKSWSAAVATIQKAVSKAQNGDTILVNDGSYSSFTLRNPSYQQDVYYELTIKSVNGPFKTTIQGGKVVLNSSWTNQEKATLEGFTIRGGSPAVVGGFVRRCIITGVTGDDFIKESNLYSCIIYGNTVQSSSRGEFVATKVYNCTIYENHGKYIAYDSHGTTFYNSILYGNNQGRYVCANWGSYAYNCRESNPQCVDLANGNFRLTSSSPCINAGNNSYASSSAKDILGNPRIYNSTVDIGAFEYTLPQYAVDTVAAVQRYPWNSLVDLQFKFTESTDNTKGQVTLSAKDVAGNTNLPMRTIRKSNGAAVNTAGESLSPGSYKWVWDAAADLPKDFKHERITVSVKVSNVTGTSGEFRMDLSGMGPWETRTAAASEAIAYSSAWATNAMSGAKAVVKVNPVKREKPRYIAIDLSGGTTTTHYPIEYLDEIPGGSWSDEYKTSKLVLRHIPAGSFIMGGRCTDYPGAVNTNLHMVTLTRDFYMGVFEVTQRQWELVMGNRPSAFTNESCYATRPVEQVSYRDIRGWTKGITWPESKEVDDDSFLGKVRAKSGLTGFDLPTEAQWQYACRAGTTTALSSGVNLSAMSNAVELATLARYAFNSGWAVDTYLSMGDGFRWTDYNCTDEKGTAKVGSYSVNPWGLYDMDGNVCEIVADVFKAYLTTSVNPVGPSSLTSNRRVYCGGCWRFPAYVSSSGDRHGGDLAYTSRPFSCGFRLSLQGGEIPEVTDGTVLVNAAGAGDATWMPTKAGTYYLTHETQTNGVNGAEVLGAWFTVGGPELNFTPDGELTPGVKVAIGGAGEGWTVRYTIDGVAPTSESPEYTAPITLNDSATIRAVAYSTGGVESEEFSATFTLHDALSVVGAVAKPRYPWNGMVDVDCEVRGEPGRDYAITLEARDLDGGTNLPVRTARQAGGATVGNAFLVKPGQYRFTWNADADIAGDCDFANVAVSVNAEGSMTVGAKRVVTLTVDGYTGTEVLTNVPTLVRLSAAIEGFSYADFADANGGDLVFCDETESVIYPHEIDEWHVGGESLVWVKLPEMTNGTSFKMAYGSHVSRPSSLVSNPTNMKHEVWSDYAGVWHMNEDSGTAYDSTAHGLDALPSCVTNGTEETIAQMVAYENGACGRARICVPVDGLSRWYEVPSYGALNLGSLFVAGGWYRADLVDGYPKIFYRNNLEWTDGGWGAELRNGSSTSVNIVGGGNSKFIVGAAAPDVEGHWVNYTFVYTGTTVAFYTNGLFATSGEIIAPGENGLSLRIGQFNGQCDEIRLRGGTLSADRIKADYDMIKNRNFLRYSAAERGKGTAE